MSIHFLFSAKRLIAPVALVAAMFFTNTPFAHALCSQGVDPAVEEILGSGTEFLQPFPPISFGSGGYVRDVLLRAEEAIAKVDEYEGTFDANDSSAVYSWLERAFSVFAKVNDTKQSIIERERNLTTVTTCLDIDLTLLEAMMAKIECRIQFAFEERRFQSIMELEKILFFLHDRTEHLMKGAGDPLYEDQQWWFQHSFDTPDDAKWLPQSFDGTWCCIDAGEACVQQEECKAEDGVYSGLLFVTLDGCMQSSRCLKPVPSQGQQINVVDEKVCPFHSDYLPTSIIAEEGAYEQTSQNQSSQSQSTNDEDAKSSSYGCDLKTLEEYEDANLDLWKIDDAIKAEVEALRTFSEARDKLIDQMENVGGNYSNIDSWMGVITSSPYFGLTKEDETAHQELVGCTTQWENDWKGSYYEDGWPEGLARTEMRGPFSFDPADERLGREYQDLRRGWGERHPLPEPYKLPKEYENPEERLKAEENERTKDVLIALTDSYARGYFRRWDVRQEEREGAMVAKTSDVMRSLDDVFLPLRTAVSELSKRGNSLQEGVRHFASGLAYYLRRSCLTRPCNERLMRVLGLVLDDDCFPYTDGDYVSGTTHEDCGDDLNVNLAPPSQGPPQNQSNNQSPSGDGDDEDPPPFRL
jgi:hypothetical protein